MTCSIKGLQCNSLDLSFVLPWPQVCFACNGQNSSFISSNNNKYKFLHKILLYAVVIYHHQWEINVAFSFCSWQLVIFCHPCLTYIQIQAEPHLSSSLSKLHLSSPRHSFRDYRDFHALSSELLLFPSLTGLWRCQVPHRTAPSPKALFLHQQVAQFSSRM